MGIPVHPPTAPSSSSSPTKTFPVLTDPLAHDTSLAPFLVSTTRGFLPRVDPAARLPSPDFDALESLLRRMPIKTACGAPGLLARGGLGPAVAAGELPDLTEAVERRAADLPLQNALYRDYSFLASAYLLEPCHERFVRGEGYGLGRDVLPACIARPFNKCAAILKFKPFMEYAGSYALYNWRMEDPAAGMDYSNLRLIRAFEHGLDASSSEAGFVLVHVEMVKNSGPLVAGTVAALGASSESSSGSGGDRAALNAGLAQVLGTLETVNAAMQTMWGRSKPRDYTTFRTFIFGITGQSMFPEGVLYEGVSDERMFFRGESGANDSMVPLMDNLLQIPMPQNPLTEILNDFRSYRPANHHDFLHWVKQRSEATGLKAWALDLGRATADVDAELLQTRQLWLRILDQVRDFRWRHWCFAREYIIKMTSHPTATGGSPIVTWLPNQLQAVLAEMKALFGTMGGAVEGRLGEKVADIMEVVDRQHDTLTKEVRKFCQERSVDL